jgi:hypothetical protein
MTDSLRSYTEWRDAHYSKTIRQERRPMYWDSDLRGAFRAGMENSHPFLAGDITVGEVGPERVVPNDHEYELPDMSADLPCAICGRSPHEHGGTPK